MTNLAHDLDKDVRMSLSDFSSLHYDKQDVTSYDNNLVPRALFPKRPGDEVGYDKCCFCCFIGLKLNGNRM